MFLVRKNHPQGWFFVVLGLQIVIICYNVCMNTFRYNYIILLALISMPFVITSAEMIISPITPSFSLEVRSVNKITGTNYTQFDLAISNAVNKALVRNWELRLWCDKGVIVSGLNSKDNICNKNIIANDLIKNEMFSLVYRNPSAEANKFKIKLKAFDGQNKWLSSASKVFFWK
jgi:hypothetical protein